MLAGAGEMSSEGGSGSEGSAAASQPPLGATAAEASASQPRVLERRSTATSQAALLSSQLSRIISRELLGVEEPGLLESVPKGMDRLQKSELTRLRLAYMERQQRRRATSMLFFGTVFGGLGFLIAAGLGIHRAYFAGFQEVNLRGEPFPSGKAYWPGSVSEMVSDPRRPIGKCWHAFETIASLAIWFSFYPWELRNVYLGGGVKLFGWCLPQCMPFLHARTFVPPIGGLLLVMISLSSPGSRTFNDDVATSLHLVGAVIMLGGHGLFEFYTLAWGEFVHIHPKERTLRWIFCIGCLASGVLFWMLGQVIDHSSVCCADEWRVPTGADIAAATANGHDGLAIENGLAQEAHHMRIYNSASGWHLVFKHLCFWSEVLAGGNMVAGLLTIWWFCPERHLDLLDELPGEYDQEDDASTTCPEDASEHV